tara:strand:- start:367 stop:1086 length:720 start_codon:yes stop_codon:yes gene_type:complete
VSEDRPPTYTAEDFSVVNDYIDRMAKRHDAAIQHRRALTSEVYIRWLVLGLAVAGISAALIIWALSAFNEKPELRIVEPRVIQPPAVNVTIDGSRAVNQAPTPAPVEEVKNAAQKVIQKLSGVEPQTGGLTPQASSIPTSNQPPAKEVVNFVIFREIEFVRGHVNKINVGMQYDKADEKPSNQWCYVNAPKPNGTTTRVDLAHKFADRRSDETLSATKARELGMTLRDLRSAQERCVFE